MGGPQRTPKVLSVTVSGGEGTLALTDTGGKVLSYTITPPAPKTGTFDIEFLGENSDGAEAQTTLSGNTTIKNANFQIYRSGTVNIANAGDDGSYEIVLYWDL